MALRLGGLADLDPAAVPLPPGTEVVTRVERVVDGEVRPGGATGRVVTWDGEPVGNDLSPRVEKLAQRARTACSRRKRAKRSAERHAQPPQTPG